MKTSWSAGDNFIFVPVRTKKTTLAGRGVLGNSGRQVSEVSGIELVTMNIPGNFSTFKNHKGCRSGTMEGGPNLQPAVVSWRLRGFVLEENHIGTKTQRTSN